jgi:membrane protein
MDRGTRKVVLLVGLGTAAVVTRAVLPSLLTRLVNALMEQIPGFKGHIEAIEFNVMKGQIGVRGISVHQVNGFDQGQSLQTELLALQLDWKRLLGGKIVGEIEIDSPRLFLNLAALNHCGVKQIENKTESAANNTHLAEEKRRPSWQEKVANLYPFKISQIRLQDGQIRIEDIAGVHDESLRLEELKVIGENITNTTDISPSLMSRISCNARVMSEGNLVLTGEGYPFAAAPTFNIDFKTERVDLRELRGVINRFLELDVRNGLMDLYVEAAAKEGHLQGYTKPIFDHLEIQPPSNGGFAAKLRGYAAKVATTIGRNKRRDRIATTMSFEGPINDPSLDIAGAITQFFRNAFATALSASSENRLWFAGRRRRPEEVEVVYRKPRQSRIGQVAGLVKATISNWLEDSATRMAASLSYYTIFSLAPLLILVIAACGLLLGHKVAEGNIMGRLEGLLGHPAAAAIKGMVVAASKPRKGVLAAVIGVVTLLFGATGVLAELKAGLNSIWKTRETGGVAEVVKRNVVFLGMLLGIAFVLAVSLVISTAISAAGKYVGGMLPAPALLLQTVNFVISLAIITLLFAAIFKILPNTDVAWHDVWIGGLATALLFTIGKSLLGLYLGKLVASSVYGAAGSILIVFLWVYYSGLIIYLGAEFTRVYAETFGSRRRFPNAARRAA